MYNNKMLFFIIEVVKQKETCYTKLPVVIEEY